MLTRSFAGLGLFLLLTGAKLSCSAPAAPDTMSGLEFTAAMSKSVIRVGESATLELRLSNRGNEPVTLHFSSGCQIVPYVARSSGEVVDPPGGGWVCTAAVTTLRVGAGGSVTRITEIRGGAPQQGIHSGAQLPPGSYRAWGKLGEETPPKATTNVVSFTVVE